MNSISLKDQEKLTKLMMLSQSDNDHEALLAVRKAQLVLANYGLNWSEYLDGKDVKPVRRIHCNRDEIEQMLSHLEIAVPRTSSFRSWVDGCREFFDKTGFLTPKQFETLERCYNQSTAPSRSRRRA